MLLLLDTLAMALAAWAIAHATGPRTTAARLAAFLIALQAMIVLTTEVVGRFVYTPLSLSLASLMAGGIAVVWLRRHGGGSVRATLGGFRTLAGAGWAARLFVVGWLLTILFSLVAVTTVPPTAGDSIRYHLTMGVSWLQQGRVVFDPLADYRVNHFPHGVEALNAWLLALSRNWRLVALPQVVISGVLWPLAAYLALRLCRFGPRPAVLGALLASMSAPVVQQMRNEGVDVAFNAALVLALVAALGRGRFYRHAWAVFAVALGLALGTKSSGPLAVGVAGLGYAVGVWLERRGAGGEQRPARPLREAALALMTVLVLGGWVYAANTLEHRNPFYPMALRLGPVVMPTVEPDQPVYYNPWIHDYGLKSTARLTGALSRWPRLFLGLEPFDNYWFAFSGGFGPLMTVCFVLWLALSGYWLLRRFKGARARPAARLETYAFVGLLLLWNLLFVSFVSLITSPWTHVDARYQLHLALLVPLLMLLAAAELPRPGRRALAWLLLAAFLGTGWLFTTRSRIRGWSAVERSFERGDPLWAYERPRFYPGPAERFFAVIGDEPIMLGNRGFSYPFYLPSFESRIYLVGKHGPANTVEVLPPIAPRAAAGALANFGYWWELGGGRLSAATARGEAPEPYTAKRQEIFANSLAYYEAIATELGARFLLVEENIAGFLDDSPRWRKIEIGEAQKGPRALFLYELAGDAEAADSPLR